MVLNEEANFCYYLTITTEKSGSLSTHAFSAYKIYFLKGSKILMTNYVPVFKNTKVKPNNTSLKEFSLKYLNLLRLSCLVIKK